jgi:hypothetical protein
MTNELDSLVVEHLRHIRSRVDQIADDVTDLRHRMTSLERRSGVGSFLLLC